MQKNQKLLKKRYRNQKKFKKSKHLSIFEKRNLLHCQVFTKNVGRPYYGVRPVALKISDFDRFDISLLPNNIFCSLKNIKTYKGKLQVKQIYGASSGVYNVKVSRKRLKYASNIVITNFFKKLKQKKFYFANPLVIVLVAPAYLRKRIIISVLKILKHVKKKNIMFIVKPKKIFNGCRARKQIRKKRKRYVIYK